MVMSLVSSALFGIAASALVPVLISAKEAGAMPLGRRGELRARARQKLWFRLAEPAVLVVGSLFARSRRARAFRSSARPLMNLERVRTKLLLAGIPLGLSVDEFLGLVLASSMLGTLVGYTLGKVYSMGLVGALGGLFLGYQVLFLRLEALYAERARDAMRDIPRAMDLAGLCMSAGMDFTAALRTVVRLDSGTIASELAIVLRGLELGLTRRVALYAFMERLPCTEVRDFCRAVAQADQKGASLATALCQQARLCRMRRSLRAEEGAARAAVLLIGPMMLLLIAILSILVGPLVIGGVGL